MELIVGILIVIVGVPLLGVVATKFMNRHGPMAHTGRFLWILGSPVLLVLGGWLIYRGL
ncbi:hypothetical protein H9Y04_19540 [Streptomyces sp. TRM66268-LWL]|uniref:Cardiolipin synthase N-terminal domain-containing protein n=1 Tax=Streptomyces polyasparticus TaxID=2767826 RepID=A0ABR7SGX2_9ACTN|nr:hypothetical protein [Streptomyces polyasparticus]MBC9714750.1 hypothetical protein [Streptomyces polyasparticus]